MNRKVIEFEANEQELKRKGALIELASGTRHYLIASFDLGNNWHSFDQINAVWYNGYAEEAVPLDEEANCFIPASVLDSIGTVTVNLEGITCGIRERLTTRPTEAAKITALATVEADEPEPIRI